MMCHRSGLKLIGLLGVLALAVAPALVQGQTPDVTPNLPEVPYGYERPPQAVPAPDTSVQPNDKPLTTEEVQRAEALLPLLDGKQEFWAMGEFVHLGQPVVPILVKALTMPGPRIRYNAIETIGMLKAASAVPALLETAKQTNEMPRIREHALRVAVRLDPLHTAEAIQVMAKDPNGSVRKTAAFEARYVRHKDVVPVLIELVPDEERYVAISALQSLWLLTRHETEMHDWDTSTKQQREEWTQEWQEWWNATKENFELPEPRQPRSRASQNQG